MDVEKGLRPDPSALIARYGLDVLLVSVQDTLSRLLVSHKLPDDRAAESKVDQNLVLSILHTAPRLVGQHGSISDPKAHASLKLTKSNTRQLKLQLHVLIRPPCSSIATCSELHAHTR